MYDSNTRYDLPLTEFIGDYAEGKLNAVEVEVFSEFLDSSPEVAEFADKSRMGRVRLKNAFSVKAAADFEEKLFKRIAREKKMNRDNLASKSS